MWINMGRFGLVQSFAFCKTALGSSTSSASLFPVSTLSLIHLRHPFLSPLFFFFEILTRTLT